MLSQFGVLMSDENHTLKKIHDEKQTETEPAVNWTV